MQVQQALIKNVREGDLSGTVRGARIEFEHITATLPWKKSVKTILNDVSASVQPGRLTALMGVSYMNGELRQRLTKIYSHLDLERQVY